MAKNAYLILANGKVFAGKSFGADGEVFGELVFSTAMTGYVEALTDPSYFGQIVVSTFPAIGNYGYMTEDCENQCSYLKAYVVREWCQDPSNFRCEGDLDTFLKQKNVVGLYGIDTRALTKIIRDEGIMNAKIAYSPEACEAVLEEIRAYRIEDAVKTVSTKEVTSYTTPFAKKTVAMIDFGSVASTAASLVSRDVNVTVYPADTSAETILASKPNGILKSRSCLMRTFPCSALDLAVSSSHLPPAALLNSCLSAIMAQTSLYDIWQKTVLSSPIRITTTL